MDIKKFIQKEVVKLHKVTLLENEKVQIKKELMLLKEDTEFIGNEPLQPGDAEYHHPKLTSPFTGIGTFNNIDWEILFEILKNNTEAEKYKKNHVTIAVNELTDVADGYLTKEELNYLIHHDLVYNWDGIPIIDNDEYLDFAKFYNKAKEIWMLE